MRFFRFQKKPLFNRGFCRKSSKSAIFDPPRKPPKNPLFDHFGHFGPPFWGHFLTPQKTPENPKNDPFWPPQNRPPPKILENGPFGENRGFQARFEPQKGGGWGFTQGPPKKAIFGHFCPFWPFLPILAIFGHFWPLFDPPNSGRKMWAEMAIFDQKRGENPPRNPPGQTDYI